jgi:hypothetical protein
MTCKACTAAEVNPMTGLYVAGCKPCTARELANSIEHAEARMLGKMTPRYMARLRAAFGDGWEAGHAEVKDWAKRITAC